MPQPHFEPSLFKFLQQLKRNNNRDWFKKHKARYESARWHTWRRSSSPATRTP